MNNVPTVGMRVQVPGAGPECGTVTGVTTIKSGRFANHHAVGVDWDTGRPGGFMAELTQWVEVQQPKEQS